MERETALDWSAIKRDYESGVMSLRQLGAEHGCSQNAIFKRAKADGWTRNIAEKIRVRTEELVNRAEVDISVDAASEEDIVVANSVKRAEIQVSHRKSARRLGALLTHLIEQVEQDGELNLPQRVKATKDAVETFRTLVATEREIWNMGREQDEAQTESQVDPMELARRVAFVLTRALPDQVH